MNAIKFRRVSDDLVEVLYDGVINIIFTEDAIQMGYREFTYQGRPISISAFARLLEKNEDTVKSTINRHNYHTGEEVINHYNTKDSKGFTYQGKQISMPDFAKLIGIPVARLKSTVYRCKYSTGEEVIEYYSKFGYNRFTYQGKLTTVSNFAKIIGKNYRSVANLIAKHKYRTGEEVIDHYNNKTKHYNKLANNQFTYQGKPIAIADFARLIGKNLYTVYGIKQAHNYHTGEEIIDRYNKNKRLNYQDKPITVQAFAKLIGKTKSAVQAVLCKYQYCTGEEVIEHYKMIGKL